MSNNYRWKEKYYDINDIEIDNSSYGYASILTITGGNGKKETPFSLRVGDYKGNLIISNGSVPRLVTGYGIVQYGQGIGKTIIQTLDHSSYGSVLFDCTVKDLTGTYAGAINLIRCEIDFKSPTSKAYYTRCIVRNNFETAGNAVNCSFVGIQLNLSKLHGTNPLFCNCDIEMPAPFFNAGNYNAYKAFSNCRFKIVDENEYVSLIGNTEDELRANFVARCEAQGIVIPKGSEYNDKDLPLYRWGFSNEPNNHGNVVKDSIIHKFQKRRYMYFGWNPKTVKEIKITDDKTKAKSLAYLDKSGNLKIENDTIMLSDKLDISEISKGQQSGSIRSNIIWLGEGKQKLDSINITHNLATQYGVMIDSDPSIIPIENGSIEAGQMYLVRTKNSDKETITYNGVSYSTALSEGNNIFVGVTETKSWDGGSQNIIVYKITDLAISNTIRMRIVKKYRKILLRA